MKFTLEIEIGNGARWSRIQAVLQMLANDLTYFAPLAEVVEGQFGMVSSAEGEVIGRWEAKAVIPIEPPINAPIHNVFCSCHLCQDWLYRQPRRVIHGAVLDEEEIAKDRAALTLEEREVLDRLPPPDDQDVTERIAQLEAERDGYVSGATDGTETPDPAGWAWWYPEEAAELEKLKANR